METINYECYVSLEVAKLLKEAGFNLEVKYYYRDNFDSLFGDNQYIDFNNNPIMYTNCISAPILDVAQRWLRDAKAIHICVKPNEVSANCKYFATVIISDTKWGNIQDDNRKTIMFDTYEEAQEAGIKKALEIILEKEE